MSAAKNGSRARSGRPTLDNAGPTKPCNMTIDKKAYDILFKLGMGSVSLGVRLAAGYVHATNAYYALQRALKRS